MHHGALGHNNIIACRARIANQIGRWDRARQRSSTKAERPARCARRTNDKVVAIDREQRVDSPLAFWREQNPRVRKGVTEIFGLNDTCRVRHCACDEAAETFSHISTA